MGIEEHEQPRVRGVGRMGIGSKLSDDDIRCKGPDCGFHHTQPGQTVCGIAGGCQEGHIEGCPKCLRAADVGSQAGLRPHPSRVRVQGYRQYAGVIPECRLNAVPVVSIDIDVDYPQSGQGPLGSPDAHDKVVEHAEPCRSTAHGMMQAATDGKGSPAEGGVDHRVAGGSA